jgi:hypothetical protein
MPYRFVCGPYRTVADHAVGVSIHAFQFADGSIARRWASEAPGMAVLNGDRDTGLLLNSDQARELAAVLLAAADEIDGLEAQR